MDVGSVNSGMSFNSTSSLAPAKQQSTVAEKQERSVEAARAADKSESRSTSSTTALSNSADVQRQTIDKMA